MDFTIGLIAYILTLCIVGLHLYTQLKEKDSMLQVLQFFLIIILVSNTQSAIYIYFFPDSSSLHRASPLGLIYGPFVYFIFYAIERGQVVPLRIVLKHSFPVLLCLPFYILYIAMPEWRALYAVHYHVVLYGLIFISTFFYSLQGFFKLTTLSGVSQTYFFVLSASVIVLLVYSVVIAFSIYSVHIQESSMISNSSWNFMIMLRAIGTSLAFYSILKSLFNDYSFLNEKIEKEKKGNYLIKTQKIYQNNPLPIDLMQAYIAKFEHLMYDQKFYLRTNISLDIVAQELKIPAYHLTQVLGRAYGLGILELVNHLRINHACDLIQSNPDISTFELISNSGFSSESTFFRNFKTIKGITPSQYRDTLVLKK